MARYRARVSGPLLERIDLMVEMPVEAKRVERLWRSAESVIDARPAILAVRARRSVPNARLEGEALRIAAGLEPAAERLLADAAARWSLSARAVHRTMRVARSIADLAGSASTTDRAIAEALSFRHETLRAAG